MRPTALHTPTRMCLGCRERVPQDELIRLQLRAGRVVIIEHRSQLQPGRSIYFCPRLGCLDRALAKGELVFKRAKYDKIIVRLEPKQAARLRFAFAHAARRMRIRQGVGPRE